MDKVFKIKFSKELSLWNKVKEGRLYIPGSSNFSDITKFIIANFKSMRTTRVLLRIVGLQMMYDRKKNKLSYIYRECLQII